MLSRAVEYAFKRREPKLSFEERIVSFTFDDAPLSAFQSGSEILAASGVRGTFYVSASLCDQETEVGRIASRRDLFESHSRGHEIANHGFEHVDMTSLGYRASQRNVRENRNALAPIVTDHFAFPLGRTSAIIRHAVRNLVETARGIQPGINRSRVDRLDLKAVPVYSKLGLERCLALLASCAAHGGWLIFYTHDVCESPSDYGCTPDQLRQLVEAAVRANDVAVMTIESAWRVLRDNERPAGYRV